MRPNFVSISKPTNNPVTLSEAKDWCKANDLEDDIINSLINSARKDLESWCNVVFSETTIIGYWSFFPDYFTLPLGNIISVTDIKYFDLDNSEATLPTESYFSEINTIPGIIAKNPGVVFPETFKRKEAVKVTYQAGFDSDIENIPDDIKTAIKLAIMARYDLRTDKTAYNTLPLASQSLVRKYKDYRFNHQADNV